MAMEEILRYWQLFLKGFSFQHVEKYFPQVIFLSRAQPKLVHFNFFCSEVSQFISRSVLKEAPGTISLCFSLQTWILQEEELVGTSFRMGKL